MPALTSELAGLVDLDALCPGFIFETPWLGSILAGVGLDTMVVKAVLCGGTLGTTVRLASQDSWRLSLLSSTLSVGFNMLSVKICPPDMDEPGTSR